MHTVFTVCFEKFRPVSGFLFITNKTTTAGYQIVIFTCYFCISTYFETSTYAPPRPITLGPDSTLIEPQN